MYFSTVTAFLAICCGVANAGPLARRAVYAGELVQPSVNQTLTAGERFQFSYLPHKSSDSRYNDPPRLDSLSVGLQGPAPIESQSGHDYPNYSSAAIMVLADGLDRDDDSGPWVNSTIRIPAKQIDTAGTYYLIVTETQQRNDDEAPEYLLQTYNISVEVTKGSSSSSSMSNGQGSSDQSNDSSNDDSNNDDDDDDSD